MKKKTYLVFIFTLLNLSIIAQTNIEFKAENFSDKVAFNTANNDRLEGLDLFEEENHFTAIPYFLKDNKFNPNNADLNLKIEISYLHTNEKQKALEHIEKAKFLGVISEKTDYYTGRAYHYLLDFESAIEE